MTEGSASGGPAIVDADSLRNDLVSRGYGHCIVGGASMLPLLRPGDIVRIERRDHVRRGDVVAVTIAGTPAIHRVVAITSQGIICCGDHCRRRDPLVPASAVHGVATLIAPGRRLRGGSLALAQARACFWLLLVPWVARSGFDDVSLAWRQAIGAPLPTTRSMPGGPRESRDASLKVLDAEAVARLLGLAERGPDESSGATDTTPADDLADAQGVEIPAGVFSGLGAADRRRLLGRLVGHRVVVWGALAQGPRVRVTSSLRRFLGGLGISFGEPGDAAFRDRSGGWRPFHLFTPEEMEAELAAAGGIEVETSVVTTLGGGGYVRASAYL